jgi:hypothetical protein
MRRLSTYLATVLALAVALPPPAAAQSVEFGDDSSDWALDGECDDPRFVGPGMTQTTLLQSDVMRDATDCRTAFNQGRIRLRDGQGALAIEFGDDSSDWAWDGECDDPRFVGPGMTQTTLLQSDVMRDATDCRTAFNDGRVRLREGAN